MFVALGAKLNVHNNNRHIHNLPIGGRNRDLNRVSPQKDLGVLVDSDLSFENHEQS